MFRRRECIVADSPGSGCGFFGMFWIWTLFVDIWFRFLMILSVDRKPTAFDRSSLDIVTVFDIAELTLSMDNT